MKPCNHEPPEPSCRVCWLFDNNPDYNRLWGGDGATTSTVWHPPQPKFLIVPPEERSRRLAVCQTCEHFAEGRCKKCGCAAQGLRCPLYKWSTRHLLYYVWPTRHHDAWRWNVEQLKRRWGLFNGRKVVAVCLDKGCWGLPEVKAALDDMSIVWVPVNNHSTWESGPWLTQWHQLRDCDGFVFRAHAKGVSKPDHGEAERLWAEMMYESCLDYWPLVEDLLARHPIVGSFKRHGQIAVNAPFFYAGSFYWVRAKEGYARHRQSNMDTWGVESWPGVAFTDEEAGEIFRDDQGLLYGVTAARESKRLLEEWKARNAMHRTMT